MNINKRLLTVISIFLLFFALAGVSPKTSAFDLFGKPCGTLSPAQRSANATCSTDRSAGSNSDKNNVVLRDIKAAANIVAFLAGAAAIIMIIVSGLSLVTSGGNAESAANARRRIINASVGLAIVALAYVIVSFVINNVIK